MKHLRRARCIILQSFARQVIPTCYLVNIVRHNIHRLTCLIGMPKILIFPFIFSLILAPKALIFAQEGPLAAEEPQLPSSGQNSSKTPSFQSSLNELFKESLKEIVQRWMKGTEKSLKKGVEEAYDLVKAAAKAKIVREAKEFKDTSQKKISRAIQQIRGNIKGEVIKLCFKIRDFVLRIINWQVLKPPSIE